jgi:hypothetical protein
MSCFIALFIIVGILSRSIDLDFTLDLILFPSILESDLDDRFYPKKQIVSSRSSRSSTLTLLLEYISGLSS